MRSPIKHEPVLRQWFFLASNIVKTMLKLFDHLIQSLHELGPVFGVELAPDLLNFGLFLDDELYLWKLSLQIFFQILIKNMHMKRCIKLPQMLFFTLEIIDERVDTPLEETVGRKFAEKIKFTLS